jgi:hypothetical protein
MQKLKLAPVGKRAAMLLVYFLKTLRPVYFLKLCGLSWRRSVAPANPVWWQMRPAKEEVERNVWSSNKEKGRAVLRHATQKTVVTVCSHSPSASSSGSPLLGLDGFFLLRRCQSMLLAPWLQTQVVSADPPPGR